MTNYVMTREQRQQALEALKGCQRYIWNGKSREHARVDTYICIALLLYEDAGDGRYFTQRHPGVRAARNLVERSLVHHASYEGWLRENVDINAASWPRPKLQAERKRWVKHLIAELQKSLDTP